MRSVLAWLSLVACVGCGGAAEPTAPTAPPATPNAPPASPSVDPPDAPPPEPSTDEPSASPPPTCACAPNEYCSHRACGTPGCTPPDPMCVALPAGCTDCPCLRRQPGLDGHSCRCEPAAAGLLHTYCL